MKKKQFKVTFIPNKKYVTYVMANSPYGAKKQLEKDGGCFKVLEVEEFERHYDD